jgi:polyisoprenoid-binding protein YceI
MFKASALLLALAVSPLAAADYSIDPGHSDLTFSIGYWSVGNVKGGFNDLAGAFTLDEKDPSKDKVEAVIQTASIDTRNERRDKHLRSADFFDVEQFPTAIFKSTKVEAGKDKDSLLITGDLTLRGVTKPVVLNARKTGEALGAKEEKRVGFSATTTLNRKDFGIAWNKVKKTGEAMLGDAVELSFDIQGIEKK